MSQRYLARANRRRLLSKMNAVRTTTGPFILEFIDDTDCNYLKLIFSDGQCRLLAKGGKWPAYIAVNLEIKARGLLKKSVYVVTSQTTKQWDTTEWICDIFESKQEL